MNLLLPKKTYDSIFDIPLVQLYTSGIRGIIFDLDNTLTEWNNPELSKETISWLEKAKKSVLRCVLYQIIQICGLRK